MVQTSGLISRHVVVRIHPRGPYIYASRTSVQLELIPPTCLERNQGLAPNRKKCGKKRYKSSYHQTLYRIKLKLPLPYISESKRLDSKTGVDC